VVGVELSIDAVEFARRKFNLTVYPGDLTDARFPDEAFDIIFMGDVLEHLKDPVATLREIHRITARRGIMLIECPTQTNTLFSRLGFAFYRLIGMSATVCLPPYHLFEYRPGSLTRLVTSCGFEIKEVNPGIIPPGIIALRGSLAQKIGKKLLHYPNFLITSILGVGGDRVEVIALRP
jgi:SAM-dependent methyltransferase